MANCAQCGVEIPGSARFCPNCGSPVASGEGRVAVQVSRGERDIAVLCHLIALAGILFPGIGNIGGPLVVWLLKRQESPFIDFHGKEAVNFQIGVTIYVMVLFFLLTAVFGFLIALVMFVGVVPLVLIPALIGLLFAVLFIPWLVLVIIAALRAGRGEEYRYPLTIRLIK